MKKSLSIIGLALLLMGPQVYAAQQAEHSQAATLWNKLSSLAQHNWHNVDDLSEAEMNILMQKAKQGDANAQYALGMLYQANNDQYAALHWLGCASQEGHFPAAQRYTVLNAKMQVNGLGW